MTPAAEWCYAAAAFFVGVPFFWLVRIFDSSQALFGPPGLLLPVSSPLVPGLAFGATSVLVAYILRRRIIRRRSSLPLVALGGYLLGASLFVPVWVGGLELGRVLSGGLPQDWPGNLGEMALGGLALAQLGLLAGLFLSPLGLPYSCLVVWLLRGVSALPSGPSPSRSAAPLARDTETRDAVPPS